MSSEDTPPPPTPENNGSAAPFKLSFGTGRGLGLAKKKAPQVSNTKASAFDHSEDKTEQGHKDELISGFDGKKIISLTPKEEPKQLVIPKQENDSWREQILAKRKKPTLVPGPGSLSAPMEITEEPAQAAVHGLQLTKRVKIDHSVEDIEMNTAGTSTEVVESEVVVEQKEETLDELAARKLIEAASGEKMESARKLVLSGQDNVHSEDVEAFQKNLNELPDEASLEDYANIPVEEFGAALLRGMGWKGDSKGNDAIEYNRRPALLGLGAKPKEPEPITKKYIKPGESRIPQSIKVPERNRTGRSDFPSLREDARKEDRDQGRGSRDSRDSRGGGDDSKDVRENRDGRDSRSIRDNRSSRDQREGQSSRDNRDEGRESPKTIDRDSRAGRHRDDRERDRDRDGEKESRGGSDRRDDRRDDRPSSRSNRDDRSSRHGHDSERRRDRSRDRSRDYRDSSGRRDRDSHHSSSSSSKR